MNNSEKLFSQINQSKNILLLCHRNPDADTMGSAGALALYIESLQKKVLIHYPDPVPQMLDFLELARFTYQNENINLRDFDLLICLDCGDTSQTGLSEKLIEVKDYLPIINIDHHQTNPHYGNLNIVEPASATAEIVYRLLKNNSIPLTKQICTCLLIGIITDTTYFTNAGTTKSAMSAASELLQHGANIKQIIRNTWKKNSPEALRVWGKILSQLQFNSKYKVVSAIISKEDAIMPEVFEGMANFLTTLYEANIIIVIRETEDGFIKCSLRTIKDNIDVSQLAQKFGGGGHAKAAGFTIRGKLKKSENSWRIISQ